MKTFFLLLCGLFLLNTAAWADSVTELAILQAFFSPQGLESRSTQLTGAALEEFSRQPVVGEYLPSNTATEFRLLIEDETSAIYEAVVSSDDHAQMWSAFFQRGALGSKLSGVKRLNIPPYLFDVEYQRLRGLKVRSAIQETRFLQLQRLFMVPTAFKEYFTQNQAAYEKIARLVETGEESEAQSAARSAALVGVRLYGKSKSEGEMALLVNTAGGKAGQEKRSNLGSELRVSGFLDSVFGLLHLPPEVSPPVMSLHDYIFVEALADRWFLFRNIAAEPLKEKSE